MTGVPYDSIVASEVNMNALKKETAVRNLNDWRKNNPEEARKQQIESSRLGVKKLMKMWGEDYDGMLKKRRDVLLSKDPDYFKKLSGLGHEGLVNKYGDINIAMKLVRNCFEKKCGMDSAKFLNSYRNLYARGINVRELKEKIECGGLEAGIQDLDNIIAVTEALPSFLKEVISKEFDKKIYDRSLKIVYSLIFEPGIDGVSLSEKLGEEFRLVRNVLGYFESKGIVESSAAPDRSGYFNSRSWRLLPESILGLEDILTPEDVVKKELRKRIFDPVTDLVNEFNLHGYDVKRLREENYQTFDQLLYALGNGFDKSIMVRIVSSNPYWNILNYLKLNSEKSHNEIACSFGIKSVAPFLRLLKMRELVCSNEKKYSLTQQGYVFHEEILGKIK